MIFQGKTSTSQSKDLKLWLYPFKYIYFFKLILSVAFIMLLYLKYKYHKYTLLCIKNKQIGSFLYKRIAVCFTMIAFAFFFFRKK